MDVLFDVSCGLLVFETYVRMRGLRRGGCEGRGGLAGGGVCQHAAAAPRAPLPPRTQRPAPLLRLLGARQHVRVPPTILAILPNNNNTHLIHLTSANLSPKVGRICATVT